MSLAELRKQIKQKAIELVTKVHLKEDCMGHEYADSVEKEKMVKVSDVLALLSVYEEKLRKLLDERPRFITSKGLVDVEFLKERIEGYNDFLEKLEKELEQ